MSRATLRARLGVTAATLIAGSGLILLPGLTSPANATSHQVPLGAGMSTSATPAADGSQHQSSQHHSSAHAAHARMMAHHDQLVHKVIKEAKREKGKPYSYGAAGPGAFDCSGLVMYVFAHAVHRSLPHNAAEQYHSLHHIKRSQLRRGDLVFTDNGSISHVGIFAGHHHWWVAPHTGTHVQKQRIYHAHFVYARVLRMHHHH